MKEMILNYVDYVKDEPDFKERVRAYVYTLIPEDARNQATVDFILDLLS